MTDHASFCCASDYEAASQNVLPDFVRRYLKGAANDSITYYDNEKAYKRYKFRPKVMRDVSHVCTKTSILGSDIDAPIGITPFGSTILMHPSGALGLAKACQDMKTCFVQSDNSHYSVEEVTRTCPNGLKWLQFYLRRERKLTSQLLKRAERLGYKAVVMTVDGVVAGKRPECMEIKITDIITRLGNYDCPYVHDIIDKTLDGREFVSVVDELADYPVVWEDIGWVNNKHGCDAEEAIKHGADAIMVSNHGGRQLDGLPATIDVLEEVVKAVNGRCEVYIDGGIRSGTDVLKALALGARAVFIGRPAAWAFAVKGEDGVKHVLKLLKEELEISIALCGITSVTSVDRNIVKGTGFISKI